MVKSWLSVADKEGFQTITYHNPHGRSKPQYNNTLTWEQYRLDPMARYLHDEALHRKIAHRRLDKDPDTRNLTYKARDVLARASWNTDAMPLILRKEGAEPTAVAVRSVRANKQRGKTSGELRKVEQNASEGNFKTRMFNRDFIEHVRNARTQRDMTQSDLAKEVNVLEADIRDLEKGLLPYDRELKSLLDNKLALK
jgi:DNA-binding XRE family transcriptional regulator